MTAQEIIEKVRTEVERLMKENSSSSGLEGGVLDLTYEDGINTALNDVLEILDTLKEQPVDLDNKTIMEEIRKLGCYPNEFDVARRFYELGRQSKPKVRFPHEKDIIYKVFGAGNLDGWEYDEAEALVALAKEELLKDIEPKVCEGLEEASVEYSKRVSDGHNYRDLRTGFVDGAQWQKAQSDKELSEKIASAYQLGLADKEKKLMKEAVEGGICGYTRQDGEHTFAQSDYLPKGIFKPGQKVKLIIIKED